MTKSLGGLILTDFIKNFHYFMKAYPFKLKMLSWISACLPFYLKHKHFLFAWFKFIFYDQLLYKIVTPTMSLTESIFNWVVILCFLIPADLFYHPSIKWPRPKKKVISLLLSFISLTSHTLNLELQVSIFFFGGGSFFSFFSWRLSIFKYLCSICNCCHLTFLSL